MKKKDLQELHLKQTSELLRLAHDLGEEINKERIEMVSGKIKNLNTIRIKMKNRARMLTIAGKNMKQVLVKEEKNV